MDIQTSEEAGIEFSKEQTMLGVTKKARPGTRSYSSTARIKLRAIQTTSTVYYKFDNRY